MVQTYITRFPIAEHSTLQDVVDVVVGWFSAESELQRLQNMNIEGLHHFKHAEIETCKAGDYYAGARVTQVSGDIITTTDIVGSRNIYPTVCVRQDVLNDDSTQSHHRIKPAIVYELIHWLGEGVDGNTFPVTTVPVKLEEHDVRYIALALNGQILRELPCIYLHHEVSNTLSNALAFQMSGMATVLQSPSETYSRRLSDLLTVKNTSQATIYWPDGRAEAADAGVDTLFERVNNSLLLSDINFPSFSSIMLHSELDKNRALEFKLASTPDECLQLFSDEVDFLTQENSRLQLEVNKPSDEINLEKIHELYEGECGDIINSALRTYGLTLQESRRKDIVAQLLLNNPPTGKRKKLIEAIKSLLHGDFNLNKASTRNTLRKLGFEIEMDKHPKIYIPGHENRKVTVPSTSGDSRTGRNMASELQKELL